MTETNDYIRTPESQNTNGWMMTGVVIASPSTGQIKALMPVLNSYSDIRFEHIRMLDANTLETNALEIPRSHGSEAPDSDSSTSECSDAKLVMQKGKAAWKLSTWRSIMRNCMSIDMKHLSTMVGLASLLGAATNMLFSFATGSPAPQTLLIVVSALGFVFGRFVSDKLRHEHHE